MKHDIKNQLITISAYIDTPEKGKASRQVRQLMDELSKTSYMNYMRHRGINALLNVK